MTGTSTAFTVGDEAPPPDAGPPDAAPPPDASPPPDAGLPSLTVDLAGDRSGSVTLSPGPEGPPLTCVADCTATYATPTTVTLHAQPDVGAGFAGWEDQPCPDRWGDCVLGVVTGTTYVTASFAAPNYVFVTSATVMPGTLGDPDLADGICRTAGAGLGGQKYIAWLARTNPAVSGRARIEASGARGWVRQDGYPVVDTLDDLVSGRFLYTPSLTETGAPVRDETWVIATGGDQDLLLDANCGDWSNDALTFVRGYPWHATWFWTRGSGSNPCNMPVHLYCFGIDATVAVSAPPPTTGQRLAFLSRAKLTKGATAVAEADAACNGEARGAGLPGSYLALLATESFSVASRFSDGSSWYRVDHVKIAGADKLLSGASLIAPVAVTADGVWTGADSIGAVGLPGTTCKNWTSSLGPDSGRYGLTGMTNNFVATHLSTCNLVQGFMCFQE